MTWLWLTLAANFLFSVGAHVDKYLLSKYFVGAAPGSLILFSALFGFVALPVLATLNPAVLSISALHVAILVGAGILNVTGVILSLYAMQLDEASVVATLFQLIPVCNYGLAYLVLGETLSPLQVLAAGLVIAGAILVSLDFSRCAAVLKTAVLWRMALASLLLATNAVLFKSVALEEDFWVSTFWSYVALAIVGVVLFAFARTYRAQFLHTVRVNRGPVVALNVFNEVLAAVGYVMITYATLLAPVALVSAVSGFQPTMAFAIGVFLTSCFPSLGRESLSRMQLAQKIVAIGLTLVGVWLIHRA